MLKTDVFGLFDHMLEGWGPRLLPMEKMEHGRQMNSDTTLSVICAERILNTMAVKEVGVRNGCRIIYLAMYLLLRQLNGLNV